MSRELIEMACGRAVLAAEDFPTPERVERHAADVADRAKWIGADDDGASYAVRVFADKLQALGIAMVALMAFVGCDDHLPMGSDASVTHIDASTMRGRGARWPRAVRAGPHPGRE